MSVGSHGRFLSIINHRLFSPPRLRHVHGSHGCQGLEGVRMGREGAQELK